MLSLASHPVPRDEVLADGCLDAASRAVPSIEVDDSAESDEYQLPEQGKNGGYCDVLWVAFYAADKTRTEAKITDAQFAPFLAQELHPYYKEEPSLFRRTNAETVARDLRSWVDLGRLCRAFYLYVEKSRTDKDGKIYQAVKKCDEEAVEYGKMVLEDYQSRMERDKAGDETITRLWTDLFLDLYLGNRVDLIDKQGKAGEDGQYRPMLVEEDRRSVC